LTVWAVRILAVLLLAVLANVIYGVVLPSYGVEAPPRPTTLGWRIGYPWAGAGEPSRA
jgi:hypothetical protein